MKTLAEGVRVIRTQPNFRAAVSAISAMRAILGEDAPDHEVIFELLCEAAHTERMMPVPRPAGHVSAWPEVWRPYSEAFAARIGMPPEPMAGSAQATRQAVERYVEVITWLRYVLGRSRRRSKAMLWALAGGMSPGRVAKLAGFPNAAAVRAAKRRRLAEIESRLKAENIL